MNKTRKYKRQSKLSKHLGQKNKKLKNRINKSLIGKVCVRNNTELIILLQLHEKSMDKNTVGLILVRGLWYKDRNPLDTDCYGKYYGKYNNEKIIGNYSNCDGYKY